MVTVPLGIGAYKRTYGNMPEIRLENRFVEKNPTNLREHVALLSRPGTNELAVFTGGKIRGTYSKAGLFNGALFVVSDDNLYRYDTDDTKTQITGVMHGTGHPVIAWMKGAGYQRLFIADGLLLQYYEGGTHASGTLTLTPGSISDQVIDINGTYYSWASDVDTGTPAGTSSAPWLAKLGATDADSLTAMADLLNFDGVPGTDFSSALGGPNTKVTASSTATTLVATAISEYAAGNAITTSIFSGSDLAWGGTTLSGGGTHTLHGITVPDGKAVKTLASLASYVLVGIANSQEFFWVAPGEITIDALDFATKESNPDNILDMLTVGDQALICGNGSTENWYATGDSDAPFAPVEGRVYQRGVLEGTAQVVKDGVILVGDDGVVYQIGYQAGQTAQWGVNRISDHGIEERLRKQIRSEQGIT